MGFLSKRGLSIQDAWTLRSHLAKRVERRVLRLGHEGSHGYPTFRNFFPDLRLIFVHVPKTAGTSVQSYFSQMEWALDNQKSQVEAGSEATGSAVPSKHLKAQELRDFLGEEIWHACYRISFVRNPWDLMVSSYNWWLQKAPSYVHLRRSAAEIARMGHFGSFIQSPYGLEMINEYFGNQLDWFNDGYRDSVHYIGQTETLEHDLRRIAEQLGLREVESVLVPRLNQSRRLDYRAYYNRDTAQLVRRRFAREIERFGYRF
jgi:Sulfotransferase family